MPKGRQGQKRRPDKKKVRTLLLESETKLREAVEAILETLKEPKYPASTVTERQKAYRAKYRKSFRATIEKLNRRTARRKVRDV